MQPHEERAVAEKDELDTKIEKLSSFIGGDTYSTLGEAEQFRLGRQLGFMQQYSEVLGERIDAF